MSWSKAQRRVAQRSINALVAERAARYCAFFAKKIERTPQSWSPTPLNDAALPITPPPIPLITTIYPVKTSSQTTGDDMANMQAINSIDNTDKRPTTQEQPINETTKQAIDHASIENIVAAEVIAYKKAHERKNPPYIEISSFAQTILEIRGYAKDGYILKSQGGVASSIAIHVKKGLHADQVLCGDSSECGS